MNFLYFLSVERLFSVVGQVDSDRRSSLSPGSRTTDGIIRSHTHTHTHTHTHIHTYTHTERALTFTEQMGFSGRFVV
jgi:hypothetical protein